jgi:hypothetical protein
MTCKIASFLMAHGVASAQRFVISRFAGGPPGANAPVAALSAALAQIETVVSDTSANLHISTSLNCVSKVDSRGVYANRGNAYFGYSGDGGPAAQSAPNFAADDTFGSPAARLPSMRRGIFTSPTRPTARFAKFERRYDHDRRNRRRWATTVAVTPGNMTIPRAGHNAVLLTSGTVFIVRGEITGYLTDVFAELFDPDSGTFTVTGSFTGVSETYTATLLANGRVLVIAGVVGLTRPPGLPGLLSNSLAGLYDPATGAFSTIGGGEASTATLLANGKVLFAGGTSDGGGVTGPTYMTQQRKASVQPGQCPPPRS